MPASQSVTRRTLLATAAAGFAAGLGVTARAEDNWPSRLVRLISPYGAGGANDISLRILAEYIGHRLGQQFIVENRPGAGTRLANESVAHASPDGYTFLYVAAPYATAEALYGKLNYERKELQPVAMAVTAPIFLLISADAPFKPLPELIAYGKSQPNGLTFASPGAGSQPHLAAELLFRDAAVKGMNVPFRGNSMAYTELLAGRVDATITAISTALPHVESGKFRVLGVAAAEPSAIYPQAPTQREQGLPNVVASGWYGFMASGRHASRDRQPVSGRNRPCAWRSRGEAEAADPGIGSARWYRRGVPEIYRRRDAQVGRADPAGGPQGRIAIRFGPASSCPRCGDGAGRN